MSQIRPIRIVLTAFYCFFIALLFLSVTANTVFGNTKTLSHPDVFLWVPVGAYITFAVASVVVGIGILHYNQLSWKVLFFGLMIGVSTVASLVMVALIFLLLDVRLFYTVYQEMHIGFMTGISFLAIFLSGIIVLYYLTHEDIRSHFGDMGELIEPF